MHPFQHSKHHSGFTLVEIMVTVVIVGLLASLAGVAFKHHQARVQATTLGSDFRVFSEALERCVMDTGEYALSAPAGQVSPVFDPYVRNSRFGEVTSVGGHWIVESGVDNFKLSLAVIDFTSSNETVALTDRLFDDGNLSTGRMRLVSSAKFSYIIEE